VHADWPANPFKIDLLSRPDFDTQEKPALGSTSLAKPSTTTNNRLSHFCPSSFFIHQTSTSTNPSTNNKFIHQTIDKSYLQWLVPSKLPVSHHHLIITLQHVDASVAKYICDRGRCLTSASTRRVLIHNITMSSHVSYSNTLMKVNPLVARPHVSSSPPRPLASPHHLPEVSRSPTDTSQELSLSVKSVVTRSRQSF
jgi:hypothetical protein